MCAACKAYQKMKPNRPFFTRDVRRAGVRAPVLPRIPSSPKPWASHVGGGRRGAPRGPELSHAGRVLLPVSHAARFRHVCTSLKRACVAWICAQRTAPHPWPPYPHPVSKFPLLPAPLTDPLLRHFAVTVLSSTVNNSQHFPSSTADVKRNTVTLGR